MDKTKQFIKKYCQGYQGWSKERTLSATKDLKSLVDSAVEEYLQEKLNDYEVLSLEYKIIKSMLEE